MHLKRLSNLGAAAAATLCVVAAATPVFASTASEAVTGGTLSFVSAPGNVSFSGVTLDGLDHTATASLALDVSDPTGSNLGWNVSLSGTSWAGPTGGNLSDTSTTVTSATAGTCDTNSTCTPAQNSVSYTSLTVPLGSAPTPVEIYNAAANSGEGNQSFTTSFALAVPASTTAGSYSSTWTVSLNSAP